MTSHDEQANLDLIREYLAALAAGEAGPSLGRFFTPDAIQVEYPNKLNPKGGRSDLSTIIERSVQGTKVLRSQTFEVQSGVASGNEVAVEAEWTGVLAIPIGGLAEGATMRAHFAMFFECVGRRIHRQRNYDCFEPW